MLVVMKIVYFVVHGECAGTPGHMRTDIAEPYIIPYMHDQSDAINDGNDEGYIAVCMPIVKDKDDGDTE